MSFDLSEKKCSNLLNRSILLILIIIFGLFFPPYKQIESTTNVSEKPFWLPFRLDVGEDYFKVNVFVLGVNENTGLIKICVNSTTSFSSLCHYMGPKEEGQIIRPFVSIHGGIFVFPSHQVPENTKVGICITIVSNSSKYCREVINSPDNKEELVDMDIRSFNGL